MVSAMNRYLVELALNLGGYGKVSYNLISAKDPKEAERIALEGECHDMDAPPVDGCVSDLGGEFYYEVYSCKELSEEEFKCLKKLM